MIGSILKIEKRIHCKLSTFINQRPPCLGAFHWEKQNRTKVFEEPISHSNDVKLQLEVKEKLAEKDRMCFVMVCNS